MPAAVAFVEPAGQPVTGHDQAVLLADPASTLLDPLVELVVRSQQAPIDVEDADGEGADCEDGEDGEDGTVVAFAPEEFAALLGETPSPVGAANDPVAEAS